MAQTMLDSLVVRIGADVAGLEHGIRTADNLMTATDRAARSMAGSLEGMARRGTLSFDALKSHALQTFAEMAAGMLSSGLSSLLGGGGGGFNLASIFMPPRAGGGAVSANRPYMVGERGPEMFVPHAAGRIDPDPGGPARVAQPQAAQITINVNGVRDANDLRRSATQVAVAVSRALGRANRGL
ncbi:MAG: hypothetical protein WEB93_06140 [Sphingomonadales bacterium]